MSRPGTAEGGANTRRDENKMTNIPKTIQASIHESVLDRVASFFDADILTVFGELFQNARRAGASRIDVTIEAGTISIADDGCGMADPSIILAFGQSRWTGRDHEHPAGMGLYSLARRGATISSRTADGTAWTTHLEAAHFKGEAAAKVETDYETRPEAPGTVITFDDGGPEDKAGPIDAATMMACHLPVPVHINGKAVEQSGWSNTETTRGVEKHDDLDIIVHTTPWEGNARKLRINFHGHMVADEAKVPLVKQIDGEVWYAAIDVKNCPGLELVLPARREVLRNDFYVKLLERAEHGIYNVMARQPEPVAVPQADVARAQALGITLPKPVPKLRPWTAEAADVDELYVNRVRKEPAPVPKGAIIVSGELGFAAQNVLQHAWSCKRDTGRPSMSLVEENERYQGYASYDRLPRLTKVEVETDANDTKTGADRLVEKITVKATVKYGDASAEVLRLDTDAAFEKLDDDLARSEKGVLIRRGYRPHQLGRIKSMITMALLYWDDEGGSPDTQRDDFNKWLDLTLAEMTGGARGAFEVHLRNAIAEAYALQPEDTTTHVRIEPDGAVSISFEKAPAAAAAS